LTKLNIIKYEKKREKQRIKFSIIRFKYDKKIKKTYGERRVGDQDPIDAMLLEKGSHSFTAKIIMSGLWSS
jgi:hypothetical protein